MKINIIMSGKDSSAISRMEPTVLSTNIVRYHSGSSQSAGTTLYQGLQYELQRGTHVAVKGHGHVVIHHTGQQRESTIVSCALMLAREGLNEKDWSKYGWATICQVIGETINRNLNTSESLNPLYRRYSWASLAFKVIPEVPCYLHDTASTIKIGPTIFTKFDGLKPICRMEYSLEIEVIPISKTEQTLYSLSGYRPVILSEYMIDQMKGETPEDFFTFEIEPSAPPALQYETKKETKPVWWKAQLLWKK
nr:MAG: hypothetical protein [Guiyang nephotettix cincticeps rhabdovirus 1]